MRGRHDKERQHLKRLWLLVAVSGIITFCVNPAMADGASARARTASNAPHPIAGTTSAGGFSDSLAADRNWVSEHSLPFAGTLSELGVYRAASSASHQARSDRRGRRARRCERQRRYERQRRCERHRHQGRLQNTSPPTISGEAQVGQALSADAGEWSGAPTSFGYQWLRCDEAGANCSPIELASESSYTVAAADIGSTLRVQVIATNAAGPSEPARSAQSAVVGQAPSPPANTSPPTIGGEAQVGQELEAEPGEWSGAPTSFGYQWLRCDEAGANCSPIELASESSYTVAAADIGSTLRVQVIATNAAGPSEPARSAQSAVVANEAGHQKNALAATSYFDKYGPSSNGEWVPWIEEHISLIRAFPPVGDWYVSHTKVPVTGYHDIYTGLTQHGTVPLTSTLRAEYVGEVLRDQGVGYAGTFMDDVNFAGGNKPSPEVQSEADYRKELANLIEDVRTALGPAAVLEINAQYHDIWPLMKAHEPEVERALTHVNIVTKEFGVGPDAGIETAADYRELTEYVDRLHEKGIHVIMAGDVNSVPVEEYNLATYFLDNDGGDYINTPEESPENWWPGNDVNLGSAVSPRGRESTGLWKREFTGGVVYTLEPGAGSSQTVKLPTGKRWFDIEHKEVTEVTLAPGTGAVLTSEG